MKKNVLQGVWIVAMSISGFWIIKNDENSDEYFKMDIHFMLDKQSNLIKITDIIVFQLISQLL